MRAITMVSLGASAVLGAGALIVAKTSLPTATPAPGAGMLSAPLAAGSKPVVVASRDIARYRRSAARFAAVSCAPVTSRRSRLRAMSRCRPCGAR